MPTPQFLQPPTAGLPNPSDYTFQGLPNIMSTGAAQQRTEMMAPFLDLAKQQQELALAEQLFQQKEYQDPTMQAGRQAEARKKITEADVGERTKEFKIQEEKLKADVAPYKSEEEIAKHKELARQHADAPEMQAQSFAGQFYPKLKATPGPLQQSVYQSEVLPAIEQRYPSLKGKLPQQLDMSLLAGSYIMSVEIAKYQQEKETAKTKADADIKGHQLAKESALGVASIHEKGAQTRADMQFGSKEQQGQARMITAATGRLKSDPFIGENGALTSKLTYMSLDNPKRPALVAEIEERYKKVMADVAKEGGASEREVPINTPPADAPVSDSAISFNEKRSGKKYTGPRPAKAKDVTDAKNWK